MFKMTQEIYRALSEDGSLKVFTDETETSSNVWLQFGIKNGGSYRIRFISRDDDNDVAVRIFSLVTIDKDKRDKVLPAINNLNNKYRFLKFILDDEGDVNVEYDYLLKCPSPAASATELVVRIVKIVDEAYPELMRAMWA